jgi:hypothetical protein
MEILLRLLSLLHKQLETKNINAIKPDPRHLPKEGSLLLQQIVLSDPGGQRRGHPNKRVPLFPEELRVLQGRSAGPDHNRAPPAQAIPETPQRVHPGLAISRAVHGGQQLSTNLGLPATQGWAAGLLHKIFEIVDSRGWDQLYRDDCDTLGGGVDIAGREVRSLWDE